MVIGFKSLYKHWKTTNKTAMKLKLEWKCDKKKFSIYLFSKFNDFPLKLKKEFLYIQKKNSFMQTFTPKTWTLVILKFDLSDFLSEYL
jgi:hypothetical protein